MSKHTTGPWLAMRGSESTGREVADWAVTVDDGHIWICTGPTWDSEFQDESYANARLIAASPCLLAAAIETMSAMDSIWQTNGRDDDFIYDEMGSELSAGYFSLRAAIAKSRGES